MSAEHSDTLLTILHKLRVQLFTLLCPTQNQLVVCRIHETFDFQYYYLLCRNHHFLMGNYLKTRFKLKILFLENQLLPACILQKQGYTIFIATTTLIKWIDFMLIGKEISYGNGSICRSVKPAPLQSARLMTVSATRMAFECKQFSCFILSVLTHL